jgi:hypothetical protein
LVYPINIVNYELLLLLIWVYLQRINGWFFHGLALDATLQFANYTLRIINTLGAEVYQSAIATPQATIDISTLSKGIYLLTPKAMSVGSTNS